MARLLKAIAALVGFFVAASLVWHGVMIWFGIKTYFMPMPAKTYAAMLSQWPLLQKNLVQTLEEGLVGLAISTAVAVSLATLCVNSRTISRATMPFAIAIRSMPVVVVAPLITLMAGRGFATAVTVVAMVAFFPIFVNVMRGLTATRSSALELMHVYGASRAQMLRYVRFPFALPHLFAGLRTAAPVAVLGAMLSEWLTGSAGLGYLILDASAARELEVMWSAIIISMLLGILVFWSTAELERRILARTT
jgi:ABC-type nitrate/sulfonate/bicarbonate transport system permease component